MDIAEYQQRAAKLDVSREREGGRPVIPLLGLAGEAGSLVSEFKKKYRDGDEGYLFFDDRIRDELGDILWYLTTVASRSNISLDEVAKSNLEKNEEQWARDKPGETFLFLADYQFFDVKYPEWQQLPRTAKYKLIDDHGVTLLFLNDLPYPLGDHLKDNAWKEDGYRFHDVFHLAYATILRWSPITRRILNCKRKRDETVDEIEDGGRAGVIEEAVAAFVFDYAKGRNYLKGANEVDPDILATIKRLVRPFEVSRCSTGDWQSAILRGLSVWNQVEDNKGGYVVCDAINQAFSFEPLNATG